MKKIYLYKDRLMNNWMKSKIMQYYELQSQPGTILHTNLLIVTSHSCIVTRLRCWVAHCRDWPISPGANMEQWCLRTLSGTCSWTPGTGNCWTSTWGTIAWEWWGSCQHVKRLGLGPNWRDSHSTYIQTWLWRWGSMDIWCWMYFHLFMGPIF